MTTRGAAQLGISAFLLATLVIACNNEQAQFSSTQTGTRATLTVQSADGAEKPKEDVPVASMNGGQVDDIFATLETEEDGGTAGSGGASGGGDAGDDDAADDQASDDAADGDAADDEAGNDTDSADGGSDDDAASDDTDGAAASNDDEDKKNEDGGDTASTDDSSDSTASSDTSATTDDSGTGSESTAEFKAPTAAELKACGQLTGVKPDKIIIPTASGDSIPAYAVIAMRITGKGEKFVLDLGGAAANAVLRGLCVFVAGSTNSFETTLGLKVQSLVYSGHGDENSGMVTAVEGGVVESGAVNLRGNQNTFAGTGLGAGCDKIKRSGFTDGFSCE